MYQADTPPSDASGSKRIIGLDMPMAQLAPPIPWKEAFLETIKAGGRISLVQLLPPLATFIIGTIIFTQLGGDTLAANALIMALSSTVMNVFGAPAYFLQTPIAKAYAEENQDEIWQLLRHGWILTLVSTAASVAILYNAGSILRLVGQELAIVEIAEAFFKHFLWGIPATHLYVATQQYAFGVKSFLPPILIGILGQAAYIGMGYALALALDLGVTGLGIAYSASAWLMLALYWGYLAVGTEAFKNLRQFQWDWQTLLRLTKGGLSYLAVMFSEYVALLIATFQVGHQGVASLAAQQVISQYQSILYVFIIGITLGTTGNVSRSFGRQEDIRRLTIAGVILGTSLSALFLVGSSFFPDQFAQLFIRADHEHQAEVLRILGRDGLFLMTGISLTADTIRNIVTGALYGLEYLILPTAINIASLWLVGVVGTFLFNLVFNWGIRGINGAIGLGFLVGASAISFDYFKKTTPEAIATLVSSKNEPEPQLSPARTRYSVFSALCDRCFDASDNPAIQDDEKKPFFPSNYYRGTASYSTNAV